MEEKKTTHPLIFHNILCEGPQTMIFVAPPPPEHPQSCNMYCGHKYNCCRCLCFCSVVVELHARCICVCVEFKCYSSSVTREGTLDLCGSGLLCPCNLNFMCVCVCEYTSQFMYNK